MLIVFFARKGKYLLRDVAILLLTQIISIYYLVTVDDRRWEHSKTGNRKPILPKPPICTTE